MKQNAELAKRKVDRLKEEAVQACGFDLDRTTDPEIVNKFDQLPSELVEIDESIIQLQLRCEAMGDLDESLMRTYEKYQDEIAEFQKACKRTETELANVDQEIAVIKPQWLESLNKMIDNINENYSTFMAHLQYSGEVYLFTGANEVSLYLFFC